MVEHGFRKAGVEGSSPSVGFVNIEKKYKSLQQTLHSLGKVVVAYSGGVDSTFLLKAAVDTLGKENVLAAIATGPSLPKDQYEQAVRLAQQIGATLQGVESDEMADTKFTKNAADRCFHCKSHLFKILLDIAKEKGFNAVIYGNNFDDKADYRPGSRAAQAFGIRAPLMEADLTKPDIRELSRRFGLPTADLPASPCLASRLPYGLDITPERLAQVEQAESFLREFGLTEFRVRHHGNLARIEVKPQQFAIVTSEPNKTKIAERLKAIGFTFVCIDLQGFRSGALNETLTESEKLKAKS
jgi:pyridinium-3,5-biscarboxylic acid mononucleotide sulfurtransferase